MKNKILPFIIGLLIGAIIASAGFVIYNKTNNKNKHDFRGAPPQMNQSQDSNNDGGTPPELPNGEMPSENNGETTENSNANSTDVENNEQTQTNS